MLGTCGYSYHEWVGPVYPTGTAPGNYLYLYSLMFGTVELDFSFYHMPQAKNLEKMLLDGGPNLTFAIKAFNGLTHKIDALSWPNVADKYIEAISPLLKAGRLEAVLFQFPYSFHYTVDYRRYLDSLLSHFKGIPVAVEFRSSEWYSGRVIKAMKDRGVSLVSLDMPELKGLPPLLDTVTSPTAYIRLHGRNEKAWWGSAGSERYDYLYTDKEIEAWADRITRIMRDAHRILVYFNNHPKGKAVENAKMLEKLLKKIGLLEEKG